MHCSVNSEQEFLSMDFQIRGGLAKLRKIFWFLSQEPHSPGYLWDPYRTHHLQSGAFHWSRLLFHPHHDWTAGGSETLPASISSQSFGLSDEATCSNLTHTMNKTLEPHEVSPTATESLKRISSHLPSPPRAALTCPGPHCVCWRWLPWHNDLQQWAGQQRTAGQQFSLPIQTRNHELEMWFPKVKWSAVSGTEQAF